GWARAAISGQTYQTASADLARHEVSECKSFKLCNRWRTVRLRPDVLVAARGAVRLLPPRSPLLSGSDGLHPVFEALAASVSVRARWRSPLHAPPSQIRELQ